MLKPRVSRIKWLYCLPRTELLKHIGDSNDETLALAGGVLQLERPEKSTSYGYLEYIGLGINALLYFLFPTGFQMLSVKGVFLVLE